MHPKPSLEMGFGQIYQLVPEKSESEFHSRHAVMWVCFYVKSIRFWVMCNSFYVKLPLQHELTKIWSKKVKIEPKNYTFLNGSVQVNFCGLQFRLNQFKHSVKRFDRFGLDTLVQNAYL